MTTLAIVGAGPLGGAVARSAAEAGAFRTIQLVDEESTIAAGKALDILQSGPIDSFDTSVTGGADHEAAAGATVVVLADRGTNPAAEHTGDAALLLLQRILTRAPDAFVVLAGAGQTPLLEIIARELPAFRERVAASAPVALTGALRAVYAADTGLSAIDVNPVLMGRPPDRWIVLWDRTGRAPESGAGGAALLARLEGRLRALWPPGPLALGVATARVATAIATGSRRTFPCAVSLPGSIDGLPLRGVWPVRREGRRLVVAGVMDLTPGERGRVLAAIG